MDQMVFSQKLQCLFAHPFSIPGLVAELDSHIKFLQSLRYFTKLVDIFFLAVKPWRKLQQHHRQFTGFFQWTNGFAECIKHLIARFKWILSPLVAGHALISFYHKLKLIRSFLNPLADIPLGLYSIERGIQFNDWKMCTVINQ